ncbi:MAG: dihydrodipicolinate synthase family protein [SAR324 cluster bacterium]|nr:dihydrodipicolinate synthase family protein [SAR324 cluster bacterium]
MNELKKASLITAIKTPYKPNGKFDLKAFDFIAERQIAGGCQGFVIGGTTGEGHLMDWEEHLILIAHAVNKYGSKVVIIGNTGSNNTKEAKRATEEGFMIGMDASLQVNPYYGKTSDEGLLAHFNEVLKFGPAFIYNVPSRTGQDIKPEIMREIAKHQNFVGVKECTGPQRIADYEAEGIACWSGNDDDFHQSYHESKSHGVISVTAHVAPMTFRYLLDNKDEALNKSLTPLFTWMFSEPNPICLNTLLPMMGHCQPVFRLPYVPVGKAARKEIVALLASLKTKDEIAPLNQMDDGDFVVV